MRKPMPMQEVARVQEYACTLEARMGVQAQEAKGGQEAVQELVSLRKQVGGARAQRTWLGKALNA